MKKREGSSFFSTKIGDLEPLFHRQLFHCFGAGKNHEQFQRLAECITPSIVRKLNRNVTDLEAILFGQAGLLPGVPVDGYTAELHYRFTNFRYKYNLEPMNSQDWVFDQSNEFPTIRIGQLAMLLHQEQRLFAKCLDSHVKLDELRAVLQVNASEYWDEHFRFGVDSPNQKKQIDNDLIAKIYLKAVIPIQELYRMK